MRSMRWPVSLLAAVGVAIASAGTNAAASPAGARASGDVLCELLDLVLPLDCSSAPPQESSPARQSEAGPGGAAPQGVQRSRVAATSVKRSSGVPRYDAKRLTVSVREGVSRQRIDALFARAGVTLEQAVPAIGAYLVGVDPSGRAKALTVLRGSDAIASAGRDVLVDALGTSPNDSDWADQWGLRLARFPLVWSRHGTANRVIVAVVDTGVDPEQPDLRGALLPGYDFVNQTADVHDDVGHGTAVAGIIAARTDNGVGIAGICSSCVILPVKVLDQTGAGDDTVVAAGIVWAADHGAQAINLSLGGPGTTPALTAALAYARSKGAIVIAAAGNDGTSTLFYPAADPNALSVAASDDRDRPYPWSNYGAWIDVSAPGCNPAPGLGGVYDQFCGTSAATPVVAGLAALALAADPTATADDLEGAVERSAVPISGFVQYGRIDAPATLSSLGAPVDQTTQPRPVRRCEPQPVRRRAKPAKPAKRRPSSSCRNARVSTPA